MGKGVSEGGESQPLIQKQLRHWKEEEDTGWTKIGITQSNLFMFTAYLFAVRVILPSERVYKLLVHDQECCNLIISQLRTIMQILLETLIFS